MTAPTNSISIRTMRCRSPTPRAPARRIGDWYSSGGTAGIEPPADGSVATVLDMFSEGLKATPEERVTIGQEIWKIITDEVWTIGTVGQSGAFMGVRVVKDNMGNIPSRQFNIQAGQTPNISRPSTFYFTDIEE